MKNKNKNLIDNTASKNKDFDTLVKELQNSKSNGCCAGEDVCNIDCKPKENKSNDCCGGNSSSSCCG